MVYLITVDFLELLTDFLAFLVVLFNEAADFLKLQFASFVLVL